MSEQDPLPLGAAQEQRAPDGTFLPENPYRFPPGQSGNPGGRPRGASIWAAIERELARDPDEDGFGRKAVEIAKAFVKIASDDAHKDGLSAMKEALARADGLPVRKEERSVEYRSIVLEERPPIAQDKPPGDDGNG